MRLTDDILRLSATDLANHLACPHLTELNFTKARKLVEPPSWYDPMVEVLKKRGEEHEAAYLEHLSAEGIRHTRIGKQEGHGDGSDIGRLTSDTPVYLTALEAMKAGAPAIVQAPLGSGRWGGIADVLLRVEKPSDLGDYSYEVVDTKLAKETKGGTILQLCVYTEIVAAMQGRMPEFMHVVSPGSNFERQTFRVADYFDYFGMVKRDLVEVVGRLDTRAGEFEMALGDAPRKADHWNDRWPEHPLNPEFGSPEPCEHCSICDWWKRCNAIRRAEDHLTFVAGISKSQIKELSDHGIDTLTGLAHLGTDFDWKPKRGSKDSIERIHHQARLQVQQKSEERPVHELLDRRVGEGLARLPEPSEADIFFDLESARFVGDHGLQYLWGMASAVIPTKPKAEEGPLSSFGVTQTVIPTKPTQEAEEGSLALLGMTPTVIPTKPTQEAEEGSLALLGMTPTVIPTTPTQEAEEGSLGRSRSLGMTSGWAGSPDEERACFERFMDFVITQRTSFPDLHVYHFGHYEPSTLKRLAQQYATREDELDDLLRAEVFVDLHSIVRQSLRAGIEQYSLKDLEWFFGYEREMDLREASKARHDLERGLEMDVPLGEVPEEVRDKVLRYNEDDCRATEGLHRWLETLRADLIATGEKIARPLLKKEETNEEREGRRKDQRELAERLLAGIPESRDERTEAEQAQWLLGNMIQFHWREEKATWWEYFRMRELSDVEYLDEQTALSGLKFLEALPIKKGTRRQIHRYSFPTQESKIREEHKLCYAGGEAVEDDFGEVVAIDYARRTVDIKKYTGVADLHPTAVFEHSVVKATEIENAISHAGAIAADEGITSEHLSMPVVDLLMRHPPRFVDGFRERIRRENEPGLDVALRLVTELDRGILPIQGPPGTGKTHIGARMACALLKEGKKVGVVANSHKVIDNFLFKLEEAATDMNVEVKAVHKDDETNEDGAFVTYMNTNGKVREALANSECNVAGGTVWMWAREDFREAVDVLFVDEAGQMALANVVAAAHGAKSVVLLGDPQQLDQPQQGSHPEGVEASALKHLLGETETMPPDRGLFLERTWRLAQPIRTYTSDLFYAGKLEAVDELARLAIYAPPVLDQTGLYFLPVEHTGNQSSSVEEAEAIRQLVGRLLGSTTVSASGGASCSEEGGSVPDGGAANNDEEGDLPSLASPPCYQGELIDGMDPFGLFGASASPTWTDRGGVTHPLTLNDILIVAPYNAQVSDIAALLPEGARVGTVDKFQGQEAPIVIYSMTTSTREDAPRGMEFLYSLNRLNVATSRAQCACILVANPAVLQPDCRSPKQMRLANAFAAYAARASVLSSRP